MDEKEVALRKRIEELLAIGFAGTPSEAMMFQGALSILTQLYGPASVQVEELRKAGLPSRSLGPQAQGALISAREDLDAGLIGSLRQQLTGGVLADFVALAREALDAGTEASNSVAAVLAAAAYEDTIRRLGREKAGILDRRDLSQVLEDLRKSGVIIDTQFTTAQGYLSFRNRSLHADFDKVDRPTTASVLAFVEELLRTHFS